MTDKKYDPEITLRASEKFEGNFYSYVDEYTLNVLKDFVAEAEAAYILAKNITPAGKKVSVGPLQFKILNDDDRNFFTEKRKFKYAPDAVLKFQLPRAKKEDATSF